MTEFNPDHSLTFPKARRLRKSPEFAAVYDRKCRVGDNHLLVFGMRNASDVTRCGLSVSRKHGGAVRRNRIKRLLRDVFRHISSELPRGLDLILIPRQNSGATREDYRRSLRQLALKLHKLLGH